MLNLLFEIRAMKIFTYVAKASFCNMRVYIGNYKCNSLYHLPVTSRIKAKLLISLLR